MIGWIYIGVVLALVAIGVFRFWREGWEPTNRRNMYGQRIWRKRRH